MKRFIDVLAGGVLLILLSPVMAVTSILILVKLGRPILFSQARPGRFGRPFVLKKFRTMREIQDQDGKDLPDGSRMTKFGMFLRSTSLDELPELWSVVKGDMSLVGPRPLLMEYLALYSPEQFRRHEVRPGITGWAQVSGRNEIDWEERLRLDVWYVDHRSLGLDLHILWLTVARVLKRTGINAPGSATAHKFTGSSAQRTRG